MSNHTSNQLKKHSGFSQIYPADTSLYIKVANGSDTVIFPETYVGDRDSLTLTIVNHGNDYTADSSTDHAFQNCRVEAAALPGGTYGKMTATDAAGASFAALGYATALNAHVAVVTISNNTANYIKVVAQGNGGTPAARVYLHQ